MKKHMTMRRLPWNAVARSLGCTTTSRCAAGLRVRGTATTSSGTGSAASAADRLKQLTQLKADFDPLGKEVEKKLVNVTINGTPRQVAEGLSIVEACRLFKVEVPTLCYHPMLTIVGQCRLCLVQLANRQGKLVAGCATHVEEGMDIITESETLTQNVLSNLQLLRCRHPNACMTCEADGHCEFQNLVYKFKVEELLPQYHRDRSHTRDSSSHSVVRDMNKCVLCTRCIRACSQVQGMHILGMIGRGAEEEVSTINFLPLNQTACISCGQCTAVCPVGALVEKTHSHEVESGLRHKAKEGKIYVAHTAPAVRVAISEEFNMAPGTVSTGKLVSALKELGFDYVFDTNFAADVTIMEEGYEFIRRLQSNDNLPMFTSCCPGWVNLVEKSYPELMPHLSTCKSPQGMMGTLVKTYFAQKLGVNPDRIVTVSIMPCVAKKDEIARPQLSMEIEDSKGEKRRVQDTDYVLTTRELGHLIQRHRIPFVSLEDKEFDTPLGLTTGAGALFGATGGVMEAALRTTYEVMTGKPLPKVELTAVRGYSAVRKASIMIGDREVRVAVVHGTKKVREVVEAVLSGDKSFDLIEVMACPGGCVGGGGEPKTSAVDPDVIRKRIDAIYSIDERKQLRRSHENPAVQELYKTFLRGEPNSAEAHHLLHTHYTDRTSEVKSRSDEAFGRVPPALELKPADHPHH